ncbi:MAG: lysophospholipid acyltransferase family protein [Alphaproteobacteria bacterium]|nr:lysophospholipid acyltransferase family protein [Alphaproteobacteria bacterium]
MGLCVQRLFGWRTEGGPPPVSKAVLIAAPHTSNWDFFHALMAGWVFGLSFQWLGKDALFEGPLGPLLRFLGGVAVDRSAPHGLVEEVARRFRASDRLLLMVPAEGTRSFRPYWKSGFYQIASQAEVPIILGWLDYRHRVAGLGPAILPTGDVRADMDRIRAFYADKTGKFPERFGTVRLRQEDEAPEAAASAPEQGLSGEDQRGDEHTG